MTLPGVQEYLVGEQSDKSQPKPIGLVIKLLSSLSNQHIKLSYLCVKKDSQASHTFMLDIVLFVTIP
jgi:hypothetical protein